MLKEHTISQSLRPESTISPLSNSSTAPAIDNTTTTTCNPAVPDQYTLQCIIENGSGGCYGVIDHLFNQYPQVISNVNEAADNYILVCVSGGLWWVSNNNHGISTTVDEDGGATLLDKEVLDKEGAGKLLDIYPFFFRGKGGEIQVEKKEWALRLRQELMTCLHPAKMKDDPAKRNMALQLLQEEDSSRVNALEKARTKKPGGNKQANNGGVKILRFKLNINVRVVKSLNGLPPSHDCPNKTVAAATNTLLDEEFSRPNVIVDETSESSSSIDFDKLFGTDSDGSSNQEIDEVD